MTATFFNHNQIIGIRLIPADALKWRIRDMFVPYSQVFHLQSIKEKKMLTIAFADGGIFKSLSDGHTIQLDENEMPICDAVVTEEPMPLIFDPEDVSFKSSGDKKESGVLYKNELGYSLPKMDENEFEDVQEQLSLIKSGKGFHLLIQLASCEKAYTIVPCPTNNAFSAMAEDNISDNNVAITIQNLTAHQFLR